MQWMVNYQLFRSGEQKSVGLLLPFEELEHWSLKSGETWWLSLSWAWDWHQTSDITHIAREEGEDDGEVGDDPHHH